MEKAVIIEALRTPVGKMGQSLATVTPEDLAIAVMHAVFESTGVKPGQVDEVAFGNLFNCDYGNIGRIAWLGAGYPWQVPAVGIERRCSSSLSALGYASAIIASGNADILLVGGVESYSQAPLMIKRPEKAFPARLEFVEQRRASEKTGNPAMIMTAENMAVKYGVTRTDCDTFAVASHRKAAAAVAAGKFEKQIVPVTVQLGKGKTAVISSDECIRPDCSIEALARLKPVLKHDGVVTAGNSSPLNDGASAMLVVSERKAKALGLAPLAEIIAFSAAGSDPQYMGEGPIFATEKLLKKTGMTMQDFDLIEINEAFAAQSIPCIERLGMDMSRVNVNGGAIAIGHPNAASGGILVARILNEMKARDNETGLVTFCCGGGQGFSLGLRRL